MAALDRLERLTDLVLVLLHASSPRTLAEISEAVPGYPSSHVALRQAFERDKRVLRDEGIVVRTEPVPGPEQFGYRIDPEDFYLPELGLEPDEQAALHLAVAGVHFGDPSGRDALSKLGGTGLADVRPVAALAPLDALAFLFDALRAQAEVHFTYRGDERAVAPATLEFRGGRWYLTGWDRGRGAPRTFRVDRIEALAAPGAPGSGVPPASFFGSEPGRDPAGEDDEPVLVHVDAIEGHRAAAEVGEAAVRTRNEDGSVLLELGVSSIDTLRSWVLGMLDHAEIVGPPWAREAMIDWLEATAEGGRTGARAAGAPDVDASDEDRVRDETAAGSDDGAVAHDGAARRRSGSRSAAGTSARLRRLLAMVSWLAGVEEATIDELGARFDVGPDEVVYELELAACCGLPPYTPDTLLEIVVEGDRVRAFLPKELARPRRLTPREGFAIAASARTILAVPGADRDGALARALEKLESVLGADRGLVIHLDTPPLLGDVREVLDDRVQAEIEYHSASADETTVRVVEPIELVSLEGHWYLDAYCHRARDVRRFRVDRIRRIRPLELPVTERARAERARGAFVPGPGAVSVTVELDEHARWIDESVPALGRRSVGGRTVLTLAVGGRAWLERLLVQAGPHAAVLAPPELATVGADAATRLLRRYRPASMKDNEMS